MGNYYPLEFKPANLNYRYNVLKKENHFVGLVVKSRRP